MFFREIGPTRNSVHEPRDTEYVTIRRHGAFGCLGSKIMGRDEREGLSPPLSVLCNHRGKINNPSTRCAPKVNTDSGGSRKTFLSGTTFLLKKGACQDFWRERDCAHEFGPRFGAKFHACKIFASCKREDGCRQIRLFFQLARN